MNILIDSDRHLHRQARLGGEVGVGDQLSQLGRPQAGQHEGRHYEGQVWQHTGREAVHVPGHRQIYQGGENQNLLNLLSRVAKLPYILLWLSLCLYVRFGIDQLKIGLFFFIYKMKQPSMTSLDKLFLRLSCIFVIAQQGFHYMTYIFLMTYALTGFKMAPPTLLRHSPCATGSQL